MQWPQDPKLTDWVFVDVETTGGKHQKDFITEIAVLHIYKGEWVSTWHSLIKPPISIAPWITNITGISNAMVANAPSFEEVAHDLAALLNGKILVAHNARFDYGFIKSEFKRQGIDYRANTLCTVKLSRALFKQHARHSLDHIIKRFDLDCPNRHRALDDAKVLWAFFQLLPRYHTLKNIWLQVSDQLKQPSLPPNLAPNSLDGCKDVPGVYRFYNQHGSVIYIGKSVQLRSRILSHFNSDHRHSKELQISSEMHALDWTVCAGDLGAQLLEAQEIKRFAPKYNVRLRKLTKLWSLSAQHDAQGYQQLKLGYSNNLTADRLGALYGLFRSQKQAQTVLEKWVTQHQLCHRLTGLENKKSGACFAYQLKKCKGACCAQELPARYNVRQQIALTTLKNQTWPWAGPILVKETTDDCEQVHLINQWCWLGSAYNDVQLQDLLERAQDASDDHYVIDLDQYHILCRFLLNPSAHPLMHVTHVPHIKLNDVKEVIVF
ncbi:exonuclease domain-containing protein [Thiomicrorhabdus aquaedulcis]|uniref:exonuclease domain-containing protein n=1 Tax=Thiomicrorhabdus aquaedulcis TaxID=2211106 RepID=UPI001E64ED49|nr:exonuclease domain-containing protein [Thiomicrorhabdus aquaedulcis]